MFVCHRMRTMWLIFSVLMLLFGASHQAASQTSRKNALFDAVKKGHLTAVKSLLARGADPNTKGHDGFTPLAEAAWWNQPEVARLLLARGADVNASLEGGTTALLIAANRGYTAVAILLLKGGADVKAKDMAGQTALEYAAAGGYPSLVQVLLAHGSDVNAADKSGNTALLAAVRIWAFVNDAVAGNLGEKETFGFYWGAPLASREEEYMNTQHVGYVNEKLQKKMIAGIQSDFAETVKILLASGADPSITEKANKSALDYAQGKANASILQLLQQYRTRS